MNSAVRFAAVVLVGGAVALLSVYVGLWWGPFLVGVVAGVILMRTRWALVAGAVTGLAAWSIPLLAEQLQYGLKETSLSLAAIMGFNGAATIPIALTVVVGTVLGLVGAWLGAAGRGAFRPPLRPVQKLPDQRLKVEDPVLAKR